jgi:hypothetical protein
VVGFIGVVLLMLEFLELELCDDDALRINAGRWRWLDYRDRTAGIPSTHYDNASSLLK